MLQITPTQLRSLLGSCIQAQQPVLVVGPPGHAKTAIVELSASDVGFDYIASHPATDDPTDGKGMPAVDPVAGVADFIPFGTLRRLLEATRPTAWMIDDLGQASQAVQAAYMPWIRARELGGRRLPDCVSIIAATNRRGDRAGVSGVLEPVKSRFLTIVEVIADPVGWSAYALAKGYDSVVPGFIRFRPQLLSAFKPTADMTNTPCPRTWSNVARIVALGLEPNLEAIAVAGAIGEAAAAEFLAYKGMIGLPDIDGIIADPDAQAIPDAPATLYATVTALGTRTSVETFPSIARYAARLLENGNGEFASVLVTDAMRREPRVKETVAFIQIATGDLAHVLTGEIV